jgi:hypothetical protein
MATGDLEVGGTAEHRSGAGRRDLLWGGGILLAFLMVATGFMAGYNPRFRRALIGWGDYRLAVVHTNDTLGYLDGCG